MNNQLNLFYFMGYNFVDVLLMMSVWLVVMVYLSKLATLRQIALFQLYLPTTYIFLYICTNIFLIM